MSQAEILNPGRRVTFRELFTLHAIVKIPMIQRDYAQGRDSAREVRDGFLAALHAALLKEEGDSSLPLDLDFVYGSMEGQTFCPLDGQQRLTTLFLLHWYLAWKDGRLEDFTKFINDDKKSQFAYEVRPSSGEFFDALVCWDPETDLGNGQLISGLIADQPWFYLSWRLDPTIQSALKMLNAIHEKFAGACKGLYGRLAAEPPNRPYITFQLLDLKGFGLSEDLYIKMNARGRPLTPFEAFKGRLEEWIGTQEMTWALGGTGVSLKDYFSRRVDNGWSNLFWQSRDSQTGSIDGKIMRLVKTLAIVTRNPDGEVSDDVLEALRQEGESFSFARYQADGCVDAAFTETLVASLDGWCRETKGFTPYLRDTSLYDEGAAFRNAIGGTSLTYEFLVQFHAYCAYLRSHREKIAPNSFWEWMRVIKNLTINHQYNGWDDFRGSIRSVNILLAAIGVSDFPDTILRYLAAENAEVAGFNQQQIREEKIKAQLMLRSPEWRSLILEAEGHGYFNGQIEFLLKFSGVLDRWVQGGVSSWSEAEDAAYQAKFEEYFRKSSAVFCATGLADLGPRQFRWERALLSVGNYFLNAGSSSSFLNNGDRDVSWKRLLKGAIKADDFVEQRRPYVKEVLDRINLGQGVRESLDSVIKGATPTDKWRRSLIENPEMMGYCENRLIRWQDENHVYLLKKSRMSAEHVELFTYHLARGLLLGEYGKENTSPSIRLAYKAVHGNSEEPYAYLGIGCGGEAIELRIYSIYSSGGGYRLKLLKSGGELSAKLVDAIKRQFPSLVTEAEAVMVEAARCGVGLVVDRIVSAVGKYAEVAGGQPEPPSRR